MTIIDKIIKGDIAPENTNVLWLNTEDNIIYVFNNGWVPTSTGGVASVYTGTEAERLAIEDPFNGLEFHQVDENGKVTRYLYEEDTWRVVVELTPEDAEYYHELATEDHQKAVADHQNAIDDHAQYLVDHESIAHKANVDGYYGQMTVGAAENLVGDSEETYTFTTQMTGGEVEFGSGAGQLTKVQGNGLAWNQLLKNGDFSNGTTGWNGTRGTISVQEGKCKYVVSELGTQAFSNRIEGVFSSIQGHKYYIKAEVNAPHPGTASIHFIADGTTHTSSVLQGSNIVTCIGKANTSPSTNNLIIGIDNAVSNYEVGDIIYFDNIIVLDISLIYGLGNEPNDVSVVEADLAKLIAQKPYYQENAGELFGTKVLHLVSYGKNLLNPANGQARLAPYSYESVVNKYGIAAKAGVTLGTITFTPDSTGVAETITPDSNGQFTISGAGTLSVAVSAGSLSDVYVWAVYDGAKDGIENYKPYSADALEIVVGNIYGKLNGAGDMVKVFSDDVMRGAGDAHDVLNLAKAEADVNMGKYTIPADVSGSVASGNRFVVEESTIKEKARMICSKLPFYGISSSDQTDITLGSRNGYNGYIIKDTSCADVAAFQTKYKGGEIFHELATSLHYTDLKLSSDGGTTFRDLPTSIVVDNWGVWEQKPSEGLTPVTGHDFEGIAATISTILPMDAVEILKSVQDNGIMTADQRAQLTSILTALQTAGIIGSFTIAETPTDKVFPITITAPVEPEPEP